MTVRKGLTNVREYQHVLFSVTMFYLYPKGFFAFLERFSGLFVTAMNSPEK